MRVSRVPFLAVACLLSAAAPLMAQVETVPAGQAPQVSTVRTVRDRVLVWRRNPSMVIAVLPKDIVLEAISRDAQWYEVRVPEKFAGTGGAIGFVYEGHVELEGPPPPVRERTVPRLEGPERVEPGEPEARRPLPPPPAFGVRGYGRVGWDWFLAKDSFEAVIDQNGGIFYGGGGQVIFRNLFVDVSIERFEKTGERVFVQDGEVFRLGIDDTITMTPITVTAGWRFRMQDRVTPYAGGGIGSVRFQEVSDFAEPDENVDERFTSYHVVVGAEYAASRWLFIAGEFRFTAVPDAIGAPGVAADFDEDNLGGYGVGVKVMIGR